MPFLLAEILNFQGLAHLIGVGSFSKMTYNAALKKRIVRHDLITEIGLERSQYWGFFELTDEQFQKIAQKGEINKILIKKN